MNTIYGTAKLIEPTYVVNLNGETCHIGASGSQVDSDNGIVKFEHKGTIVAMFRLEDVESYYKIL